MYMTLLTIGMERLMMFVVNCDSGLHQIIGVSLLTLLRTVCGGLIRLIIPVLDVELYPGRCMSITNPRQLGLLQFLQHLQISGQRT